MKLFSSALYTGHVVHRRLKPKAHRLAYRVFSLYADLDELPKISRRLKLFSHNRHNVFSLFDRDYGPGENKPLRPWIEKHLRRADIDLRGGPIRVLCYPRILGYVFNPLSTYFCYRNDGSLAAILYEVHNTYRERHSYLIPVSARQGAVIKQSCAKEFYVSPFIAVDGTYQFTIVPPGEKVAIAITKSDDAGALLHASFSGQRKPLSDGALAKAFFRYPLMTLKVIAGIHVEAVRLRLKGIRFLDHPAPPRSAVSVVTPSIS